MKKPSAMPKLGGVSPEQLLAATVMGRRRSPRGVRSLMPKGGTLSPKGDLGALRGEEGLRAVPGMKQPGKTVHAARELPGGKSRGR
jgi:hypothetical protein